MTRRTDIMRSALRAQTLAAAPGLVDCIWSPYLGPRPARPYAEWRPIAQPAATGSLRDSEETLCLARQVDVQVLSATVGQPYRLEFNYTSASNTPIGGDTVTTVRDDLLAQVNLDKDPVTASAISTDTLRLTGVGPGDLWRVDSNPVRMVSTAAVGSPIDIVELARASLSMTASLNIYSKGVSTDDESSSYAHDIDSAFRSRRVSGLFAQEHLAVTRIADPVNLDNVPPSQDSFESRTAVDFMISLPYWRSEFIEEIQTTIVTVNTDSGSITVTV